MDNANRRRPQLTDDLVVRELSVDDIARVRRLQIDSFSKFARSHFTDDEISAFNQFAMSDGFAADRYQAILDKSLVGAYHTHHLVGTGEWGWSSGPTVIAQVRGVFVDPIFGGCGVGRQIVGDLEGRIRNAGFDEVGVRSTVNATSFFEQLGYRITSHGQQILHPGEGLAVTFMRKTLAP